MQTVNYPQICIRSKTELAKRLSHKGFDRTKALVLINDVLENFDRYWKDNLKLSKPEEEKWVRNAKGSKLGILLRMINEKVLAPHDALVPDYIFGGISNRNHVQAAKHLLGGKRRRGLLKLDAARFFEQIDSQRVQKLLMNKCGCSFSGAALLAKLCCIPLGKKGSDSPKSAIARGFATSSRLAVWCSIDTFYKLNSVVHKKLIGKDPRIAIYVDDIGITAAKVSGEELKTLALFIKEFLEGLNRPLPLNEEKLKRKSSIQNHQSGMSHLGIDLGRNKLSLSGKTRGKIQRLKDQLRKTENLEEKKKLKVRLRGLMGYKDYVQNTSIQM